MNPRPLDPQHSLAQFNFIPVRRRLKIGNAACSPSGNHGISPMGSATFNRRGSSQGITLSLGAGLRRTIGHHDTPDCCHPAAKTIKARPPHPAIRPVTWYFLVAGVGFEPTTSGL